MKKTRFDFCGVRGIRVLGAVCAVYLILFTIELPRSRLREELRPSIEKVSLPSSNYKENEIRNAPERPFKESLLVMKIPERPFKESLPVMEVPERPFKELLPVMEVPERPFKESLPVMEGPVDVNERRRELSELEKAAVEAWDLGKKAWEEMEAKTVDEVQVMESKSESEACPGYISMREKFSKTATKMMMRLPCGLRVGSSITLVGRPRLAHKERNPRVSSSKEENSTVLVSQFMLELQGLNAVDGEDPPRILHFNPRLKGDWSEKPVLELNTCYRMQWASSQRCSGWGSKEEEETVDGLPKCEKWITNDVEDSKQTKTTSWLNRLLWGEKKLSIDWAYPFVENKLFVLTLSAGLEGYHISVDGKHVTSFPYRTGFVLEDATGFSVNGDIDVHTVVAVALPTSHSSFSPQRLLDMSDDWKAPPLPEGPADLFIGILSAGNHFAERMAVRKTWMQSKHIRSSNVVARFFVALNGRKEVNTQLKKEADFYGDMIIVPFMDNYELVVLKTIAICEYGIHNLSAKYIMKCDDDNFVRVDVVLKEVERLSKKENVYIGNLNYYHKPLRAGKWAVTYEEWPEEDYPPYANGPGYIISSDIAKYIVSQYDNKILRLFKMEDVSMGMWVEQYNASSPVHYSHNWKFCQFGCIDDYITAHYQSPRQMFCMWDKLSKGKAQCCNMRR